MSADQGYLSESDSFVVEETSPHDNELAEATKVKEAAKKETSFMRVFKGVVLLSIFLAATLVSTGSYLLLTKEEDDDFAESVSYSPDDSASSSD